MTGLIAVVRSLARGVRTLASDAQARGLVTVAIGLIAIGTVFYRQVEDLTWLDGFYFTVVTLTTVGYGDITPTTVAGKLFTVAYLLIGIGIIVAFVGEVAGHVMAARSQSDKDSS